MGEGDDTRRPGFDHWVSHRGQGRYHDNEWNLNGERRVVSGYYTNIVTELAIEFLDSDHGDRPFLLILGHKAPHTPFTPEARYAHLYDDVPIGYPASATQLDGKPKWVEQRLDTWHGIYGPIYGFRKTFPDRSEAAEKDFDAFVRSYAASIKSIDDSVGRIRSALERLGVLGDTLIVFAGDNGMFLGEYGMTDKRAMNEPSIRVPLIVRYPALARPGTVIEQQVLNIDLAPSIVEICGAEPLGDIHGESWARLLRGDVAGWRTSWYYEYNYEKQFPYTPNVRGVRTDRWKFVRSPHSAADARAPTDRHTAELYDLQADPVERFNLIADPRHAATARALRAELDRLVDAHGGRSYQKMPVDEGIQTTLPDAHIR
jgi:N-acetylglucosamine-6-sulfatase